MASDDPGASQNIQGLDQASSMLWSLVIAFSLYSFLEILSDENRGCAPPMGFWAFVRDAAGGIVVTTMVVHNFFVNRRLLDRFGLVYAQCKPQYSGWFHWLLFTYIASFFGLVAFYRQPTLAFVSLAVVGAASVVIAAYEMNRFCAAKDAQGVEERKNWTPDLQKDVEELSGLYSYWLKLDVAIIVVGVLGAVLHWWLAATGEWSRVPFIVTVGLLLLVDMCVKREFYFGSNEKTAASVSRR